MTKDIATRPNPKLTPTFEKGDVVFLTKDSFDHRGRTYGLDPTDDYNNEYFEKDCFFVVLECGLSKCFVNEMGKTLNFVDAECPEEWCGVEAISDSLDDINVVQGAVRAKYLKSY